MAISNALNRVLCNIFYDLTSYSTPYKLRHVIGFTKNNIYNRFLKIPVLNKNNFEIPCMCFSRAAQVAQSSFKKGVDKFDLAIPLYNNTYYEGTFRTSSPIITQMFGTSYFDRISRFNCGSRVYYGGRGIILDKDYKLKLLYTIQCEYGDDVIYYIAPILRIDPSVFVETKDPINKFIINQLIPYYATKSIALPNFKPDSKSLPKVITIISSLNSYITNPHTPSVNMRDEDINKLLNEESNNIINEVF